MYSIYIIILYIYSTYHIWRFIIYIYRFIIYVCDMCHTHVVHICKWYAYCRTQYAYCYMYICMYPYDLRVQQYTTVRMYICMYPYDIRVQQYAYCYMYICMSYTICILLHVYMYVSIWYTCIHVCIHMTYVIHVCISMIRDRICILLYICVAHNACIHMVYHMDTYIV